MTKYYEWSNFEYSFHKGGEFSLKKLLFVFLFLISLFLVGPSITSAAEMVGKALQHAYRPYRTETNWTRARVNNVTSAPQKRLVCVEAWNNVTGGKTHLGCLWVDLAPMGSMSDWAKEFDVPTSWLAPGSYTIRYSYQADDGSWHGISGMSWQMHKAGEQYH